MRLAVLSDVHGNLRALEAVLAEVGAAAPDLVLNLGDVVSGPLEAGEVAELLMARGFPTVRGNHDRHLAERPPERLGRSDRMARERLSAAQLGWLAGLPPALRPHPAVLAVHGRPGDDLVALLEEERPGEALARAEPAVVAGRLGAVPEGVTLVLCGHSHLPGAAALPGGPLVVNPGSVGLQAWEDDDPFPHRAAAGSPHARWALVERGAAGWSVSHRATAYDWAGAAEAARRAGRRAWARALETGWP